MDYDASVFSEQTAIGSLIISYTLTQSGHYRIDISDSFGTHLSNSPLETYLSPSVIFASECEIIFSRDSTSFADLKAYNLTIVPS